MKWNFEMFRVARTIWIYKFPIENVKILSRAILWKLYITYAVPIIVVNLINTKQRIVRSSWIKSHTEIGKRRRKFGTINRDESKEIEVELKQILVVWNRKDSKMVDNDTRKVELLNYPD